MLADPSAKWTTRAVSVDQTTLAKYLRAALDAMPSDPTFAPFIDARRFGVVGFSLSGTTAFDLAWLRSDGAAKDMNCATGPDAADYGFFLRSGLRFDDHPGFEADARDDRVSMAVSVVSGFGGAVDAETLQDAFPGITVINLGDAVRLAAVDVGPEGNDLAARFPGAAHVVIAPANRFTFLGTCTPGTTEMLEEEGEDPICSHPEGTDRSALHARLVDASAEAL